MTEVNDRIVRERNSDNLETLYRMQAQFCGVLGHPRRFQILDLLAQGEKSNAELLLALGASRANLAQHLALMKQAGMVVSRRQGRQTFHRLAFPEIAELCRGMRRILALRLSQSARLAEEFNSPAPENSTSLRERSRS